MQAGKLLLTLLTCISMISVYALEPIYVMPGGTGSGTATDPTDLQTALTMAQTDGFDNIILLREGNYPTSSTYVYDTANCDNMDVVISGGWEAGFGGQGPVPTILNGNSTNQIFRIVAAKMGLDYFFRIENMTMSNGYSANDHGGALYVYNGDASAYGNIYVSLDDVIFAANSASNNKVGGAIFTNADMLLMNCQFENNEGSSGGALYIANKPDGSKAMTIISKSSFIANSTYGWQGNAIFNNGTLMMNDCLVKGMPAGNVSGDGGSIYNQTNSRASIDRCVFEDNVVQYWGAALDFWNADGVVTNSLFVGNKAGGTGTTSGYGAISYYHDNNSVGRKLTVTNCSFINNLSQLSTSNGSAIVYRGNTTDTLWVYNNIVVNEANEGGLPVYNMDYSSGGTVLVSHNLFTAAGLSNAHLADLGGNLLSADPGFVTGANNFHLDAGSAAINAGHNLAPGIGGTDLDGKLRILDGTVDIGAYEYNRAPTDVMLSSMTVDENVPYETVVATLTGTDPDAGDMLKFYLATGDGANDRDNFKFMTDGDELKIIEPVNYEEKSELHIYLKTEDSEGLSFAKAFVIDVNDLNEPPQPTDTIPDFEIDFGIFWTYTLPDSLFVDEDEGDQFTYTASRMEGGTLPAWLSFDGTARTFEGTPDEAGAIKILVEVTDKGGLKSDVTFELMVLPQSGMTFPDIMPIIYPNPTNGNLRLNWGTPLPHGMVLEIYTVDGNRMMVRNLPAGMKTIVLDLSGKAKGFYWIKGDGFIFPLVLQ